MNKTKFTSEEFESIKELVNQAIYSMTKVEVEENISKLQALGNNISGNTSFMFNALVESVRSASGWVNNKEQKVASAMEELAKLEKSGTEKP